MHTKHTPGYNPPVPGYTGMCNNPPGLAQAPGSAYCGADSESQALTHRPLALLTAAAAARACCRPPAAHVQPPSLCCRSAPAKPNSPCTPDLRSLPSNPRSAANLLSPPNRHLPCQPADLRPGGQPLLRRRRHGQPLRLHEGRARLPLRQQQHVPEVPAGLEDEVCGGQLGRDCVRPDCHVSCGAGFSLEVVCLVLTMARIGHENIQL